MASVAPVNRVTNSRTQRLVWRVGDFLLAPYRKLRPPPEESVVYQLAYATCFTLGVMTPLLPYGASEAGWWGAWAAGGLLALGGAIGFVSLWPGFWAGERAAIFAVWGGLLVRGIVVLGLPTDPAEEVARVLLMVVVCLLLLPRFRAIRGLTLDPDHPTHHPHRGRAC